MAADLRERLRPVEVPVRRRVALLKRWGLRAWLDLQDARAGTRDPLLPPRRLGLPSQIAAVGEKLVEVMAANGGLDRDSDVLDMGSPGTELEFAL